MLKTYKPQIAELWFKQMMMSDEETVSYNHAYGGTIPFPEDKWKEWYERWVQNSENKRYYRYLKDDSDSFVGEISYHYDSGADLFMADVVIYSKYRGRGYGGEALELLCSKAKGNGLFALYDEIASDNPAIDFFLRHGFVEVGRGENTVTLKRALK